MKTVAIQGVAGSFHDIAVRNFFKVQEIKLVPCDSIKELFAVIKKDNSIIGRLLLSSMNQKLFVGISQFLNSKCK